MFKFSFSILGYALEKIDIEIKIKKLIILGREASIAFGKSTRRIKHHIESLISKNIEKLYNMLLIL